MAKSYFILVNALTGDICSNRIFTNKHQAAKHGSTLPVPFNVVDIADFMYISKVVDV